MMLWRLAVLSSTFLISLTACASSRRAAHESYPPEWWAPVPESERASWEILPQDAKPGEVIVSKRTDLGAFSNLTEAPFVFESEKYSSVEAFWQMLKYPEQETSDPRWASKEWPFTRGDVQKLSGFDAKHAGDKANAINQSLHIDWVSYRNERFVYKDGGPGSARHYELIEAVTRAKLEQNPALVELLLKTCGLMLRMDHEIKPSDPPAYQTPTLLMKLREAFAQVRHLDCSKY